jgi:bifunctional NMN adenylyltransferase/nudix hydrolase
MSLGIYIGRFQPFHNAHLGIAVECLRQVDLLLLVLGSAQEFRTPKNPFTVAERSAMIRDSLEEIGIPPERILTEGLDDHPDDEVWCADLRKLVGGYTPKPILFGAEKDNTSYYLRIFPDWELRVLPVRILISATEVRQRYFSGEAYEYLVPAAVTRFLQQFAQTPDFAALKEQL